MLFAATGLVAIVGFERSGCKDFRCDLPVTATDALSLRLHAAHHPNSDVVFAAKLVIILILFWGTWLVLAGTSLKRHDNHSIYVWEGKSRSKRDSSSSLDDNSNLDTSDVSPSRSRRSVSSFVPETSALNLDADLIPANVPQLIAGVYTTPLAGHAGSGSGSTFRVPITPPVFRPSSVENHVGSSPLKTTPVKSASTSDDTLTDSYGADVHKTASVTKSKRRRDPAGDVDDSVAATASSRKTRKSAAAAEQSRMDTSAEEEEDEDDEPAETTVTRRVTRSSSRRTRSKRQL